MTIPSDRQVTNYTISDFWNQRLGETIPVGPKTLIQGWSFQDQGLETFKEAPLTLSKEVGVEDNPLESLLLLVSAPGAVGKTTLARQTHFTLDPSTSIFLRQRLLVLSPNPPMEWRLKVC